MHPFIDREPVNWLKPFAANMMSLSSFKQNWVHLFWEIYIFFFSFQRLGYYAKQA